MEFGVGIVAASEYRWCGARGDKLQEALALPEVLDALIEFLEVPAKPGARAVLSAKQKMKLVDAHLAYLARAPSSAWSDVPEAEIAAAMLHRASIPDDVRKRVFQPVDAEEDLRATVRAWIERERRLTANDEVPLGRNRADVVGRRAGSFWDDEHVLAVELKNRRQEFDRAMNQLSTYAAHAHEVYLACTPDFIAQLVWHHFGAPNVHRYDGAVLDAALGGIGAGLLVVDDGAVTVAKKAKRRSVNEAKLREVRAAIAGQAAAPSPAAP
jgi:hypothetical protein